LVKQNKFSIGENEIGLREISRLPQDFSRLNICCCEGRWSSVATRPIDDVTNPHNASEVYDQAVVLPEFRRVALVVDPR